MVDLLERNPIISQGASVLLQINVLGNYQTILCYVNYLNKKWSRWGPGRMA